MAVTRATCSTKLQLMVLKPASHSDDLDKHNKRWVFISRQTKSAETKRKSVKTRRAEKYPFRDFFFVSRIFRYHGCENGYHVSLSLLHPVW